MIKIFQGFDIKKLEEECNNLEKDPRVIIKSCQETQSYDSRDARTIITISVRYTITERHEDRNLEGIL